MYVKPKKYLGQHFLANKNIAQRIVDSMEYLPDRHYFEIGPGTGVLTAFLLEKKIPHFSVIEIDDESIAFLKSQYPELIIHGMDFLKTDLQNLSETEKFSIIGNFPYNISSQIFFKLLEHKQNVKQITCMLQKEVAERISAGPGSKTYGILSVLLQAYFHIKYLFTVEPGSFVPPPKVKSAVIKLDQKTSFPEVNHGLFVEVVKKSFNQRRKTLRNSLKSLTEGIIFGNEILSKRPEQLSVDEFVGLVNVIDKQK